MKIAVVLYDRLTALDAIGPYEVLSRLPGAELAFVAARTGPVTTDNGMLALHAERSLGEFPSPDIVLVPGGTGRGRRAGWGRGARVAAPSRPDDHLDNLRLHRLADPCRSRSA